MNIGFLVYPNFTALDLVGPYEVLTYLGSVRLVAAHTDVIIAQGGLITVAHSTFEDAPLFDILVVPGGLGTTAALESPALLSYIQHAGEAAHTVMSVCTGALLVAAAGLAQGKTMTTHWLARQELTRYGIQVSTKRVVRDGKIWSSAGVSAGIDAALELVAALRGDAAAQEIQLQIEYDPQPPFQAGSPLTAPSHLVSTLQSRSRFSQSKDVTEYTTLESP